MKAWKASIRKAFAECEAFLSVPPATHTRKTVTYALPRVISRAFSAFSTTRRFDVNLKGRRPYTPPLTNNHSEGIEMNTLDLSLLHPALATFHLMLESFASNPNPNPKSCGRRL